MEQAIEVFASVKNDNKIQLSKITVDSDYAAEWNVSLKDFLCLTKNGKMINNHLFRTGMFGGDLNNKYFMLLKYVEDIYPDSITKDKRRKKHLDGRWCILDSNGTEKKTFDSFKNPYLVKNSPIYHLERNYFNIETSFHYCNASGYFETETFLFLENKFDKDAAKRGVLKILKSDGTFELFR